MSAKHARREAPATGSPFTEYTWETLGLQYGRDLHRDQAEIGWMGQHDLSVELWRTVEHWDFESAASAVEAAGSHLPVLITWTNRFMNQVEVHTGYAIIEHVAMSPRQDPRLRLRYSGFGHYVHASQVRTIEQAGVALTYQPAPIAR